MESKSKVDQIIKKIAVLDRKLEGEMDLRDELGIDSLGFVELVIEIENKFKIQFKESDLDLEKLKKINDIYKLVESYEDFVR